MQPKILEEKLVELEKSLFSFSVRNSKQKLTDLLHPQFKEIGYSGRVFNFQQIVADLRGENPPAYKILSIQYEITQLADDVALVSYLTARKQPDGSVSRHARRNSIWKMYKGNWALIFHQATPIS